MLSLSLQPIVLTLQKMLANDIRRRQLPLSFTVLLLHHLLQLVVVPVVHVISLSLALFALALVKVQALLLALSLNGQIVGELAFSALPTLARLEEGAQHRLWIDALVDLLRGDHRLEELVHLRQLLLLLLLLREGILLVFCLEEMHTFWSSSTIQNAIIERTHLFWIVAKLHLIGDLLNKLLLFGTFFVLQAECFVLQMVSK